MVSGLAECLATRSSAGLATQRQSLKRLATLVHQPLSFQRTCAACPSLKNEAVRSNHRSNSDIEVNGFLLVRMAALDRLQDLPAGLELARGNQAPRLFVARPG